MSEGVNEAAVSFVDSSTATTSTTTTTTTTSTSTTTENDELDTTLEYSDESETPPDSPPSTDTSFPTSRTTRKATYVVRKYRKYSTNGRAFHLIDGKKIRSALTQKKWPPRNRRVSFPIDDKELVTGYLEPANPWEHAKNVNIEDLISSYKASCQRHGAEPMENLIAQFEKLDLSDDERCPELSLKNECLDAPHCEPLEELLKRVQFEKIDVESSSLDDESATILFDMLEYYQSARHLNMSNNRNIGSRGWQACAQMIKKTTCLEQLEARDITLTQQHMNILKRPLQLVSHLHVLKLQNCGLAGRAFVILVAALKMNTGIKELYLADNGFEQEDAIQLGALLRVNNHLQLLDISNNHIKDEGVRDLLDGLVAQSGESRNGKGLSILVLWNNDLTRTSSTYFSEAIAQSHTLETLNIGKNSVGNELLEFAQEPLTSSRVLLQLGMQSTRITCKGALLLAGIIEKNRSLQRIDLRDNNIQMEGLAALSFAMKRNPCVTQLDLDPTPWSNKPATLDQYLDLVAEIRKYCGRNEEPTSTDESTEESGSPQHRSRLSSVSSRKISLTCQTLPRSPPSVAPNTVNDIATRSTLEPKRTSGGRLRSPAPSPIPSPVASPVPSPSRGRFVVSRVCENSLSSTNSSASSSPVTPSSLGSSPTCFFPTSPGVSSRFRVTVVESTVAAPSVASKTIVTTASANVTVGFNYNIQGPENSGDSDDSNGVFRSDVLEDEDRGRTAVGESDSSLSVETSANDEPEATPVDANDGEPATTNETKKKNEEEVENSLEKMVEETDRNEVPARIEDNQTVAATRAKLGEVVASIDDDAADSTNDLAKDSAPIAPSGCNEATRTSASPSSERAETKVNASRRGEEIFIRDEIMARHETRSRKPEQPQRQASSLERLLGLFQHPGSFFSAGSYAEKAETRNPIQERVNSMIALGDKFQQYLRDGRSTAKSANEDSNNHPILQRSASDASRSAVKPDPVKSLSIPQLSSIQTTCARESRYEATDEESKSIATIVNVVDGNLETLRRERVVEESLAERLVRTTDERISRISEDSTLPESAREEAARELRTSDKTEKSPDRRENAADDSSHVVECKTSICPPKLKDIPEYSILETREASLETREISSIYESSGGGTEEKDHARIKCDSSSSTTDSINDPSYKDSSHCKVKCDMISGAKSVHTLGTAGDVHNFFTTRFNDETTTTCVREGEVIPATETREKDDQTSTITIEISEDGRDEGNDTSERLGDSDRETTMPGSAFDLEELDTNEEKVAETIDSDPPLTDPRDARMNFFNEPRLVEAPKLATALGLETILAIGDVRRMDTIEEFLPTEVTVSSSIEAIHPFANDLPNESASNRFYAVDFAKEAESTVIENEVPEMIQERTAEVGMANEVEASDERASELIIRVPSCAIVKNEFAVARIAIASIDDEDFVPASIDQISSSLSEDSGYSGKLSVDDTRNGDASLSDPTEVSPANETTDSTVTETLTMADKGLESNDTSFDEKSLKMEEPELFVRANVESGMTSFLSVEAVETRADSADAISSESSEDLIFKMTDIDATAISKDAARTVVTKIDVCNEAVRTSAIDRYYETGRSSSDNLFIETSRNAHRNSQDSGIEEATVSISEETCLETNNQPAESFQESLDSGIDSECSSVCARVDVAADAQKERARDPGKPKNAVGGDEITARFASSRIDVDRILGTKDIGMINDAPAIARIDNEINVNMNISDVLGSLGEESF